jgi:translocation and assembly module TamA
MAYKLFYLFLFLITGTSYALAFESYTIDIKGVNTEEHMAVLKSVSRLISLQDIPPVSDASLKRRAKADLQNFSKALQSFSLYDATVDLKFDFDKNPVNIVFTVNEGNFYTLAAFNIISSNESLDRYPVESINLEELEITLQANALPKDILLAEEKLLSLLEKEGFPLSKIEKRDVIVDVKTKTVAVTITINEGQKAYFGDAVFSGNHTVFKEFLYKKIAWRPGSQFDPCKIERTQNALEQTGLFKSISIENGDLADDGTLPVLIEFQEAKHRSIGLGAGYATERGLGAAFEWEHRNVRNMGEKLSLKTNLWKQQQEATVLYMIPDFLTAEQDLRFILDYEHQKTKGFTENSYSFSTLVERQLNEHMRISYGGMYKQLHDTRSDNDRDFNLIKAPLQFRFNNTNSLLDPTVGYSLNLKVVPSFQVFRPQFFYTINTLVSSFYLPITEDHRLCLANKITFGTILGANRYTIPPSERFYAGSENLMRGYHYMTVSPLNRHHKPTGGRSMIVNSLELRYRMNETIGFATFYEMGNVYQSSTPDFREKLLNSAGIGVRYYTPVGPLRLDVAFPLNRRKHVDGPFQFYISIGQAF